MQVLFTAPTRVNVRESFAQTIDMITQALSDDGRQFDRDEDPPVLGRFFHFGAGSRISVSFVAVSTAVLVKGKARGVTLRQSSS